MKVSQDRQSQSIARTIIVGFLFAFMFVMSASVHADVILAEELKQRVVESPAIELVEHSKQNSSAEYEQSDMRLLALPDYSSLSQNNLDLSDVAVEMYLSRCFIFVSASHSLCLRYLHLQRHQPH